MDYKWLIILFLPIGMFFIAIFGMWTNDYVNKKIEINERKQRKTNSNYEKELITYILYKHSV